MITPDGSAGAPTRPPLEPGPEAVSGAISQTVSQADWQAEVQRALGLAIDVAAARVSQHGRPLHLSPTEFALLHLLAQHHRSVVPGEHLAHLVAGEAACRSNAVARHMSSLRRKLGAGLIRTIRARGYMLGAAISSAAPARDRG